MQEMEYTIQHPHLYVFSTLHMADFTKKLEAATNLKW